LWQGKNSVLFCLGFTECPNVIAGGNGRLELPWTPKDESEKPHEAEFKRRILELSKVRF
jgi:hypothetical protein